jgi:hypothetical protein
MPILRRGMSSRSRRLLRAAGLRVASLSDVTDAAVCREVAFHAASSGDLGRVLMVAERLLASDGDYGFVLELLEDLQAVVSHGAASVATADQVSQLLGPRSSVCWSMLAAHWTAVAAWARRSGMSLGSSADLLSVQSHRVRVLLWTASHTLPTGETVDIADAVGYERAGHPPVPGHSHIAAVLDVLGQGGVTL